MFSICNPETDTNDKARKRPEPLKFKLLKSINVLDILLQKFALPKKK